MSGRSGASRWATPVTALSVLIVACLLIPGAASAQLFALLSIALPVALIALAVFGRKRPAEPGAAPEGRRWGLGLSLVALLVTVEAAAFGVLWLSAAEGSAPAGWIGLPPATVVQLVGLWLLPLPLVALAYALTFDRSGITDEDLERLRFRVGDLSSDQTGDRSRDRASQRTPDRTP